MFAWPNDSIVHQFHKLSFFSVSFNGNIALVGQLCKTLHCTIHGSVPILQFPIHTFWIQQHAILLLHLVFLSQTESDQVSLNDIFMRLSTRHNSTTGVWIDESSTPLVSLHAITSSGTSPPHFHGPVSSLYISLVN